jgi:pleiotropic regulator 1
MAAAAAELPVEGKSIKALTLLSLKRTLEMFAGNYGEALPMDEERRVPRAAGPPRCSLASRTMR